MCLCTSETLCDGEVGVSLSGDTISLKCGSVDTFSLTKESAELRPFLFHLVGQLQSTRTKLKGIPDSSTVNPQYTDTLAICVDNMKRRSSYFGGRIF